MSDCAIAVNIFFLRSGMKGDYVSLGYIASCFHEHFYFVKKYKTPPLTGHYNSNFPLAQQKILHLLLKIYISSIASAEIQQLCL